MGGMFDIRVLPDCSVSEIFQGVEKCATDFGNQFPYYNQPDMCSMQLDAMVGCMTDLITTCLSSNCPTILDPRCQTIHLHGPQPGLPRDWYHRDRPHQRPAS